MSLTLSFPVFKIRPRKRKISKEVEQKVVSVIGKSDVQLSQGRYLTEKDIDELREKAFSPKK